MSVEIPVAPHPGDDGPSKRADLAQWELEMLSDAQKPDTGRIYVTEDIGRRSILRGHAVLEGLRSDFSTNKVTVRPLTRTLGNTALDRAVVIR